MDVGSYRSFNRSLRSYCFLLPGFNGDHWFPEYWYLDSGFDWLDSLLFSFTSAAVDVVTSLLVISSVTLSSGELLSSILSILSLEAHFTTGCEVTFSGLATPSVPESFRGGLASNLWWPFLDSRFELPV